MAARARTRMSVAEFLEWNPGDGRRYQLIDGEPCAMSPASVVHGLLQSELGSVLRNHLRAQGSACRVITAPGVIPTVQQGYNLRIPDLAVTCTPVRPGMATLADAVLIVEILSPSNQADTRANVPAYAGIASVREILVVRSDRVGAELLSRTADGAWPERPVLASGGRLPLVSIGLALDLDDVYADTGLADLTPPDRAAF